VIQFPSAPIEAVRIINIRFNRLKIEVHRVGLLELELGLTNIE